jgi:uncharacterized cupredoxin-like copper-binding protein
MRTRILQLRGVLAALLVSALFVAGCGGGGGGSQGYVEPKGPAVQSFDIHAGNFYFKPKTITTAKAGVTKLTLTADSGIHTLVFDGAFPGFQLEVSGGGDSSSSKVDLKPGKYTFYCNITGHRAQGMEGTITVK